jgi:hypothetical protein
MTTAQLNTLTKSLPMLIDMNAPMVGNDFQMIVTPHRIVEGSIRISTETGAFAGDYYHELGLEFAPELTKWAKQHNVYFEWRNPAEFTVVQN